MKSILNLDVTKQIYHVGKTIHAVRMRYAVMQKYL